MPAGAASVVFERGNRRHETRLPLLARNPGYRYRLIPALAWTLTAVLVLLRAPGARERRLFFAATLWLMIVEFHFQGESPLRTYASVYEGGRSHRRRE